MSGISRGSDTRTLPHMVQLDGLRALAVIPVVVHHLLIYYGGVSFNLGAMYGVKLFFVLSGFLITLILLRSRAACDSSGKSRMLALRVFYTRRVLRIFPLYYLVVAVAVLVNLEPARKLVWSLVTYTLNFHMGWQGWFEAHFAHFWSLCVEEQFYIVWPWMILLVPKQRLLPLVVGISMVSFVLRILLVSSGYTMMTMLGAYVYPWMNLDTLGGGALLALLWDEPQTRDRARVILRRYVLPISLACVATTGLLLNLGYFDPAFILHDTALAAFFMCAIAAASSGIKGPAGRVLSWPPVVYIGRISYGIYVYHPFVPPLVTYAVGVGGTKQEPTGWVGVTLSVLVSGGIASLSWFAFERPINRAKRHFRV